MYRGRSLAQRCAAALASPVAAACRSFATLLNNTALSAERRDELMAGAPVDPATNRSTANVFYTVAEMPGAPGAWQFTYNLFYP